MRSNEQTASLLLSRVPGRLAAAGLFLRGRDPPNVGVALNSPFLILSCISPNEWVRWLLDPIKQQNPGKLKYQDSKDEWCDINVSMMHGGGAGGRIDFFQNSCSVKCWTVA